MKNIEKLLSINLTRRQFLTYIGSGILAITGISGLFEKLSNFNFISLYSKSSQGSSSGAYGGEEKI